MMLIVRILLTTLAIIICLMMTLQTTLLFVVAPVKVNGDSMFPTYKDGELTIAIRFKKNPHINDVCIFESPTDSDMVIIKRITDIQYDGSKAVAYYVEGDNRDSSFDSRNYGFISKDLLMGVIKDQRERVVPQQRGDVE